jgi:proteasome accessory factor B
MSAKVERLVNLVVALLETRRPLTLDDIKRRVRGYGHDDPESARRQFERDKADLRRLGVPVETVATDAFETEWGYRIDRRAYEMSDLDLTSDEVAALVVALTLTEEEHARIGLAKVAARAPDPVAPASPAARVTVGLDELEGVAEALLERRALQFDYRTAVGEASTRTLDPYGVLQRGGAWYLIGRDQDRDAERAFRLDRMASAPRPVGEPGAFAVPPAFDVSEVDLGPDAEKADVRVRLSATAAALAARGAEVVGRDDDGTVEAVFHEAEVSRLMSRVLALGSRAEVIAPPELRAEVQQRLRHVVRTHSARS